MVKLLLRGKITMKSLNKKILTLLIVTLIGLCSFLIIQWNKEKTQSSYLNSVMEQKYLRIFTYLTKELYDIADTLNKYDDGFTEQEMGLFTQSLGKDIRTLNETGMNLSYLFNSTSLDGILIYEDYIWKIEEVLGEIKEGTISDENEIHSIGNVITKQNEKLSDMLYGEEQVGVEGINTKEEVTKVIEIIDSMNKEIDEIVNK